MEEFTDPYLETNATEEETPTDNNSKKINLIFPLCIIAFLIAGTVLIATQAHSNSNQTANQASTQDDPFSFPRGTNSNQQNVQGEKTGPVFGPTITHASPSPTHAPPTPNSTLTSTPSPSPSPTPTPKEPPTSNPSQNPTTGPSPTPTTEPTPSSSP